MVDIPRNETGDTTMKLTCNGNDITGYCTSVNWSGSAAQAARTVVFSVAYSPDDKNVKTLSIKLGDKIEFYPDGKKVKFSGIVTTRERTSIAGTLTYSAMERHGYTSCGQVVRINSRKNAGENSVHDCKRCKNPSRKPLPKQM